MLVTFMLCSFGCNCDKINFIGMTKEQVAEILERGPRMKKGCFRIKYPLQHSPPNTLVHHFYDNKESLLKSSDAMNASQWQVLFHVDGNKWHSYLLEFKNGIVVNQMDKKQPYWTMAEP